MGALTEVIIASACRTPIGKYGKAFRNVEAPRLGAAVVQEAVNRAGIRPEDVDEVLMGNVVQAGVGQAPARQAALFAGLPVEVACVTINKVCASGMKAVAVAYDAIRSGSIRVAVAGGMESMSRAPHLVREVRWGVKVGHVEQLDSMLHDGLWDVYNRYHMGVTGDNIAKRFSITREEQDKFSLESHHRAIQATVGGKFKEEILPVEGMGRDGPELITADEGIRTDTDLEKLGKLAPAFDPQGTVTAGNASQLSDGASALVVMSAEAAQELGVKPLAKITGYSTSGVRPENIMEAPIPAVQKLLRRTDQRITDFDLFEHNEAYASASLAVMRQLDIPHERLNVHGGAVALGHPLACTGARILTTLLNALKDRGGRRGIATLCLGGGNAMAMAVER